MSRKQPTASMSFADLVLDTGELVRIQCPAEFEDEFYNSLEHAMKRGDCWCPSRFNVDEAIGPGERRHQPISWGEVR